MMPSQHHQHTVLALEAQLIDMLRAGLWYGVAAAVAAASMPAYKSSARTSSTALRVSWLAYNADLQGFYMI